MTQSHSSAPLSTIHVERLPARSLPATSERSRSRWSRFRALVPNLSDDTGAATAEYAIATLAAVGLAGLLVVILKGDDVKGMLTDLIHRALTSAG
ncbi:DUF4244 domain-containing protein [Herbiconiux sp. A18JL235]|uniref:DUF4244 domain-containing protein n=1 Tax=Herbiconiux sp. A18JL235 TaxID=3152363 RepID=A0AB39BK10_9MICO